MERDGRMILERSLFGKTITCRAEKLDQGVHVLLTGGDQSHIGAYTLAEPGRAPVTTAFPGHKDQFLSEPWAKALSEKTGARTLVVCGIHYDNATKEQIGAIVDACSELLAELLEKV